ncbi:DNA-directed RNA polymerase subunit alpha C-terminal domain-containing protein [Yersinia alsatica]|uniref:DNA-directed RNA polymerase subunit alpha C-terminal domain-containing protein n=1 Tax=Yersinia alsatica TaxID=2890317 RepID=UPI001643F39B|nr:DNA-directed RNA polymerase subunit alpha C-terminal domain-containing protein [Yersinia alsatica]
MDTTTSREEFEKWWIAPEQTELRESCSMGWASKIWQASRESIEKKAPPKIENHMSQPIAVLDISSRTKNAILNGGISTIGDLLRMGHLGVLKVPGIGRGCEAEIKSALANLSIEWKPWGESE